MGARARGADEAEQRPLALDEPAHLQPLSRGRPAGPPRVAFVTCAELPDLDPDDRLALGPLSRLGVAVDGAVWDDPAVAWDRYDLVVVRSAWDYARRRDEFVAWARGVPTLANPADVIAWNTDKVYLREVAAAGVPVVPTQWVTDAWAPASTGEWVVKPAVSAGSVDTGRYDLGDPGHRELAQAHVDRLVGAGRVVMVQPYLSAVDAEGETSLVYLGGAYSHAIRKGPMLDGPDAGVAGLYKEERITPREPTAAQLALADAAFATVPGVERLLYARVDLLPGADGASVLIELELTEPSLFLGMAPGAAERLASAISRHLT